jgi:hypothetical protein
MKKTLLILACTVALAGNALGQSSPTPRKPSGAIRENPAAEARHLPDTNPEPVRPQASSPSLSARPENGVPHIPNGTPTKIRLQTALSTRDNNPGDTFTGEVMEAVVVHGKTLIPVGASISGHLTRVAEPRRIAGNPSLDLHPETVNLPNGQSFNINATVVDTSDPKRFTVTDEGRIKGKGRTSTDNVALAGATGSGAIAGAVVAGGVGSLVGAAAGASVTTGHWLFKRHSTELPAGTEIYLEFNDPATSWDSGLE